MTKSQFADLMLGKRFQPKVRSALYLVLVDGLGQTEAASKVGIQRQQVNRAIHKILKMSIDKTQ